MASMSDLLAAKSFLGDQLLRIGYRGGVVGRKQTMNVANAVASAGQNVHAVGIGKKMVDGERGSTPCVRVYVVQKLPESLLSPRDVIPAEIDGIPTDVIEAEPAFAWTTRRKTKGGTSGSRKGRKSSPNSCTKNRKRRQRPVKGGISAGHRDITAGTLGCFCRGSAPGDDDSVLFALSNNHVFADVNRAAIGDPLYQPGPMDGGGLRDYFADLYRFVPIHVDGVTPNRVDAAIGRPISRVAVDPSICMVGDVRGTTAPQEEMEVRKHGRTTGYTEGVIDDIDYTGLVGMDHNDSSVVGLFEKQLRIVASGSEPFGLGGDSGSAVLHRTRQEVVGLYFAGPPSGMYGLANRIEYVLNELEVVIP